MLELDEKKKELLLALLGAVIGGEQVNKFKDEVTSDSLIKDAIGIDVNTSHKLVVEYFKSFTPSESYEGDLAIVKSLFSFLMRMSHADVSAMLLDFILDD